MKCLVCFATWEEGKGALCPLCGYDATATGASDPQRIQQARATYRDRTLAYAPTTRVTTLDKVKPWLGLLLGMVLFVFWLRACSTGGFF